MTTGPDKSGASVWTSGLILATLAAICTALVAVTHRVTAIQITANEEEYLEQSLIPVLGGLSYTNNLSDSALVIDPPHELPGAGPATVYRAYSGTSPVAALFVVSARDGYSGPIKLLIGIDTSMSVTRVRILEHRETPGLGDLIEASKSDWIRQFEGKSLSAPSRDSWMIKRDGGEFDQLTGASITPRAVIKAIRETLLYFEANRDKIFSANAVQQEKASE
jgi:electron transport complex protein RnfG